MALVVLVVLVMLVVPGHCSIRRLTSTTIPCRYKLNIETHFEDDNFTFYGEEWLDFNVTKSTGNLTLHSKGLDILEDNVSLTLLPSGFANSSVHEWFNSSSMVQTIQQSGDLLCITFQSPLKPRELYRLHLSYRGELSTSLTGYYRESFFDLQANTTRWLASTTFEPTDARRAFPCFDEPGVKSTFQINLARRKDQTALSNMPLEKTTPIEGHGNMVWDHFQESPPMSTYLVAFYVGPLRSEAASQEGRTPFRVWARPDAVQHTRLAAHMGSKLLGVIAELTAIDNPLPKQDVLALPVFVTEALENWGLISFGEKHVLHRPGITPASVQERSAFILAHELAHNWFGNLVGVKWWSDIWLNEGFASYYAALAVDQVRPEWDSHTMFAGKTLTRVLALDSLSSSHPLTFHVNQTEQLRSIFDPITYLKGYYVLRMLSHSLGEATFLRGASSYLRAHMFSSASQEELWLHLTKQAHQDNANIANSSVQQLMQSWSHTAGYPILSVLRNYEDSTATVRQKRFLREDEVKEGRAMSEGWWVPVTFTTQARLQFNNTRAHSWLRPSETYITLHELPAEHWLLLNLQATGMYRVQYDERNWRLLARFLDSDDFKAVHVLNRVQLLDDSLTLARTGQLAYPVALQVLSYVRREDHALPWMAALDNLEYVYRMISTTNTGPAFKNFVLRLVSGQYERLGFQTKLDEAPQEQALRRRLRRWACTLGHPYCVRSALRQLDAWQHLPHPDQLNHTGPYPLHLPLLVDYLSSGSKLPEHLDELEKLTKMQAAGPESLQQAAEKSRFDTRWLHNNVEPISSWLEQQSPPPPLSVHAPKYSRS